MPEKVHHQLSTNGKNFLSSVKPTPPSGLFVKGFYTFQTGCTEVIKIMGFFINLKYCEKKFIMFFNLLTNAKI